LIYGKEGKFLVILMLDLLGFFVWEWREKRVWIGLQRERERKGGLKGFKHWGWAFKIGF
jgi:hypothetical protein